jgi:uncharacterized Zn finger protein
MDSLTPQINLRECETIKCESCEGIFFKEVLILKKVSRLQMPGSIEDQKVPFSVYKCDNCGHVNQGFNPFEENEKILIND